MKQTAEGTITLKYLTGI